jgi:hypothetical protein
LYQHSMHVLSGSVLTSEIGTNSCPIKVLHLTCSASKKEAPKNCLRW